MAVKKADLLKEAEELGIEVNDEMTVPQLKAAIAEAKGEDPEEEEKKPEREYYEEWYCRIKLSMPRFTSSVRLWLGLVASEMSSE